MPYTDGRPSMTVLGDEPGVPLSGAPAFLAPTAPFPLLEPITPGGTLSRLEKPGAEPITPAAATPTPPLGSGRVAAATGAPVDPSATCGDRAERRVKHCSMTGSRRV